MLDYLITSRARRALLLRLWVEGDRGSVSALARACGLSFTAVHRELEAMAVAGLAVAERQGSALEYRAERRHPQAGTLTALLTLPAQGRPVAVPAGGGRRSVEHALVDGLMASHADESVALAFPATLWREREQVDFRRLAREATRRNERQSLGLFLQLAGQLGGDRRLMLRASVLRDRRRTLLRPFFSSGADASEKSLPLARRWGYLLNLDLDSFAAVFTRELRRGRG